MEKVLDEVGEPGMSGTGGGGGGSRRPSLPGPRGSGKGGSRGGGVRRGLLLSNEGSLGATTGVSLETSPE